MENKIKVYEGELLKMSTIKKQQNLSKDNMN